MHAFVKFARNEEYDEHECVCNVFMCVCVCGRLHIMLPVIFILRLVFCEMVVESLNWIPMNVKVDW